MPVPADVIAHTGLWGVKDSGGDDAYTKEVLAAGKGVLNGSESDLWRRLTLGVQGTVSALANVVPDQIVALWQCAQQGDEGRGRRLAEHLAEVRRATKEYASPGLLKRLAQARHGAPMGTVRPPLEPTPRDYDAAAVIAAASAV